MASPAGNNTAVETIAKPHTASLGWALRRALVGFAALITIAMLSAWLLYSSIDPDDAVAAGLPPPAQTGQD